MNMSSRDPSKKWQGALPEPAGTGCQACLEGVCSVHRAGTAYRTTHFGTVKRFVDDLANGAGTPAALRAAAEATIDMARGAPCRGAGGASYFVVAQYVAGTDDHRTPSGVFANRCAALSQNKTAL
jgi:hypothetical protein